MSFLHDAMWESASYDATVADVPRYLSAVSSACTPSVSFLMGAHSFADFHNRLAMHSATIDQTLDRMVPNEHRIEVRAAFDTQCFEDFQAVLSARGIQDQERNAHRMAERNARRRVIAESRRRARRGRKLATTADELNNLAEFDHPIQVHPDGSVTDAPANVYAPSVYEYLDEDGQSTGPPEIDGSGWEFVDGFSGQQGYSGPVMHPSEYLGGGMARHVLENPGIYVVVEDMNPEDPDDLIGWCLLKKTGAVMASRRTAVSVGDYVRVRNASGGWMDNSRGGTLHKVKYVKDNGDIEVEQSGSGANANRAMGVSAGNYEVAEYDTKGVHGSRKVAWSIDEIRSILTEGYKTIDGMLVDSFSASAMTQVYDALSDANKAKVEGIPLERFADFAFKHVSVKKQAQDFDPKTSDQAWFIYLEGEPVAGPFWSRESADLAEGSAITYGELSDGDGHTIEVGRVDESGEFLASRRAGVKEDLWLFVEAAAPKLSDEFIKQVQDRSRDNMNRMTDAETAAMTPEERERRAVELGLLGRQSYVASKTSAVDDLEWAAWQNRDQGPVAVYELPDGTTQMVPKQDQAAFETANPGAMMVSTQNFPSDRKQSSYTASLTVTPAALNLVFAATNPLDKEDHSNSLMDDEHKADHWNGNEDLNGNHESEADGGQHHGPKDQCPLCAKNGSLIDPVKLASYVASKQASRKIAYGIACPVCAYYGMLYCRETVGTCDRCGQTGDVDMDYSKSGDRENPNQTLCLDCLDLPDVHFDAAHEPAMQAEAQAFLDRKASKLAEKRPSCPNCGHEIGDDYQTCPNCLHTSPNIKARHDLERFHGSRTAGVVLNEWWTEADRTKLLAGMAEFDKLNASWFEGFEHGRRAAHSGSMSHLASGKDERYYRGFESGYDMHKRQGSFAKGAPFAGYADFDSCVAANKDKDDANAYCATIMRKVEDGKKSGAYGGAMGGDVLGAEASARAAGDALRAGQPGQAQRMDAAHVLATQARSDRDLGRQVRGMWDDESVVAYGQPSTRGGDPNRGGSYRYDRARTLASGEALFRAAAALRLEVPQLPELVRASDGEKALAHWRGVLASRGLPGWLIDAELEAQAYCGKIKHQVEDHKESARAVGVDDLVCFSRQSRRTANMSECPQCHSQAIAYYGDRGECRFCGHTWKPKTSARRVAFEAEQEFDISVCQDCLMLIANGDTSGAADDYPGLLPEWDGWYLAPGGEEDDEGFSRSGCEGCGSSLGGDRYKVRAFKIKQGSRRTAKHQCVYDSVSDNHSDDILEVYSGSSEPRYICGYHESRFGVPGSAKSPLNSDGSPKADPYIVGSRRTAADQMRNASPQAWRRLRAQMTEGELTDIAADIAAYVNSGDPALAGEIADALISEDWERFRQAMMRHAAFPQQEIENPSEQQFVDDAETEIPPEQEQQAGASETVASDIEVGSMIVEGEAAEDGSITIVFYEVTEVTPEDGGTILMHIKGDTEEFDIRVPETQGLQVAPKAGETKSAPKKDSGSSSDSGGEKKENPFAKGSRRVTAWSPETHGNFVWVYVPGGGAELNMHAQALKEAGAHWMSYNWADGYVIEVHPDYAEILQRVTGRVPRPAPGPMDGGVSVARRQASEMPYGAQPEFSSGPVISTCWWCGAPVRQQDDGSWKHEISSSGCSRPTPGGEQKWSEGFDPSDKASPYNQPPRTGASKSDTCPKCGAHMDDVTVQGNTLTANCKSCGWHGTKTKTSAADDFGVSMIRVRQDINGQITDYLKANNIPWEMVTIADGRQMYQINGEILNTGEAADKYLPGGFKGNFGGPGRTYSRREALRRRHAAEESWETTQASLLIWNTYDVYNALGSINTVAELKALMAPYISAPDSGVSGDLSNINWEALLAEVLEDEYVGTGGEGRTGSRHPFSDPPTPWSVVSRDAAMVGSSRSHHGNGGVGRGVPDQSVVEGRSVRATGSGWPEGDGPSVRVREISRSPVAGNRRTSHMHAPEMYSIGAPGIGEPFRAQDQSHPQGWALQLEEDALSARSSVFAGEHFGEPRQAGMSPMWPGSGSSRTAIMSNWEYMGQLGREDAKAGRPKDPNAQHPAYDMAYDRWSQREGSRVASTVADIQPGDNVRSFGPSGSPTLIGEPVTVEPYMEGMVTLKPLTPYATGITVALDAPAYREPSGTWTVTTAARHTAAALNQVVRTSDGAHVWVTGITVNGVQGYEVNTSTYVSVGYDNLSSVEGDGVGSLQEARRLFATANAYSDENPYMNPGMNGGGQGNTNGPVPPAQSAPTPSPNQNAVPTAGGDDDRMQNQQVTQGFSGQGVR